MTAMTHTRDDFPDGFVFGTATSAYQIEGHAQGGAGPTHWDSFAATPGNVERAENGDLACDHLHRWEADLDLIRDAGFDSYRFSMSWARLLPDGRGTPNAEGLAFYDRLIDGMLERGLKPAATLYHWEMPQPLADMGGWRNADMPAWFGDMTDLVARKFGDRLWSVAPINEPWCVAWLSHFMGVHAPGLRDIRATARAIHHVLKSHGTAIGVMRGQGMTNLGAVCNFEYAHPLTDSPEDVAAADRYDGFYNRVFLSGLFHGRYPDNVLEGLEPHLPSGWQDDFGVIQAPLDWLGLNYYTCKRIAHDDTAWPALKEVDGPPPHTQMGWEIYPEGLHHFLTRTATDYTGELPLYVTENGMANPDVIRDGRIDDQPRIDYLNAHLASVRRALDDGAPVKGYYVWSLMDNYEWSRGYDQRFGLVHVDFDTLERTPKASWHAVRDMLVSA
jgi:beta-glucosidase